MLKATVCCALVLLVGALGCADSGAETPQGAVAISDIAEAAPFGPVGEHSGPGPGRAPGGEPEEEAAEEEEEEPTIASSIQLALEGEGLRVFLLPSGSSRPVSFGMPKNSALEILTTVRQSPPTEQGESAVCQLSYANWADGLTAWFSGDRFTGWSLRPGSASLSTAGGIGLGSTRMELESVHQPDFGDSTLGVEFTADGLAGLLESAEPDAKVLNLWAGTACVVR